MFGRALGYFRCGHSLFCGAAFLAKRQAVRSTFAEMVLLPVASDGRALSSGPAATVDKSFLRQGRQLWCARENVKPRRWSGEREKPVYREEFSVF